MTYNHFHLHILKTTTKDDSGQKMSPSQQPPILSTGQNAPPDTGRKWAHRYTTSPGHSAERSEQIHWRENPPFFIAPP